MFFKDGAQHFICISVKVRALTTICVGLKSGFGLVAVRKRRWWSSEDYGFALALIICLLEIGRGENPHDALRSPAWGG